MIIIIVIIVIQLLLWATLLCFSLALRPHCLTEVGLGALLSRLS